MVGKTIFLNGLDFTVIGVAPEWFHGPNAYTRADVYIPLAMAPTHSLPGRSRQGHRQLLHREGLMFPIAAQQSRGSASSFPGLGGQGLLTGFPHRGGRLHPEHVLQPQLGQPRAKLAVDPIAGVGHDHTRGNTFLDRSANLLQRDLGLGLKLHLLRNSRLSSGLALPGPSLRQVESPGDGQAGSPGRDRQAHRHPAVLLFAHLAAILPHDPDGVGAFLGEPRVIHDPGHHRSRRFHSGQDVAAHLLQHRLVAPGCVRHQMVQRLMDTSHVFGGQACGHGLHALAPPRQQQPHAVISQGNPAVGVLCGLR